MNVQVKLHRGALATSSADALVAYAHAGDEKIVGLTGRGFDGARAELARRGFSASLGATA